MKKLMIAMAAMVLVQVAKAQTAEEVIAKYIQAIGGKEKLAAITSVKLENTMSIMGNETGSTVTVLNGKGFKSESEFNGTPVVQALNEKGGWAINPMGGGSAEPMPEEAYKANLDQLYIFPLLDYAAHGGKVTLAGKEKVKNADAYKIVLTTSAGSSVTYFIDATSFYVVRSVRQAEMMGNTIDLTMNYADFKQTDNGIVVPFTTEADFGGNFSMTSKLNKATWNLPVDPAIYEMK